MDEDKLRGLITKVKSGHMSRRSFVRRMVDLGLTAPLAAQMLNYDWASQIGSIDRGKFADIIAVAGNPLADVSEMERVKFVMKGGVVIRNEVTPTSVAAR